LDTDTLVKINTILCIAMQLIIIIFITILIVFTLKVRNFSKKLKNDFITKTDEVKSNLNSKLNFKNNDSMKSKIFNIIKLILLNRLITWGVKTAKNRLDKQ
jgi:hypothetical protein